MDETGSDQGEDGYAERDPVDDEDREGVVGDVAEEPRNDEIADDEGFVEENLWTGIGRARSGCGAALVGDPDQVTKKLQQYIDLGMSAFILSGYTHASECDYVGRYVLPRLRTAPLTMATLPR